MAGSHWTFSNVFIFGLETIFKVYLTKTKQYLVLGVSKEHR
jgi:hypothetical protein